MTAFISFLVAPLLAAGSGLAQGPTPEAASRPCRAGEVATALDFWVGNWDVYVGDAMVGHNRIEPILDGCALIEHWRDSHGVEGKSLFAFDARLQIWLQTWVTGDTSVAGGLKQKRLVAHGAGTTTFQGEMVGSKGAVYWDRTILTRLTDGSVRQLIEVSRDGVTWRTSFDATYRRSSPAV